MVALRASQAGSQRIPEVEGTRILLRRQHRGGQPGSAGQTECVIPSEGISDRAEGRTSC
jgi:hypothetical protein